MNLADNKELFEQAVLRTSEWLNINPAIIEKDYYVTRILKQLVTLDPNIIFKGGTSLSKCYKLIERFSEDVDLNYDNHGENLTVGMRRNFSKFVMNCGELIGMELYNLEEIYSRRNFNRYVFRYPAAYSFEAVKSQLIIETAVEIKSFPTEIKEADSYIYQYLRAENLEQFIDDFALSPFDVVVQKKERTFVDKIFAVCDYYLSKEIHEHSRHLYDLYKLLPTIEIGDELVGLINDVRSVRKESKMCLSAQDGCNVGKVLKEIINNNIYRNDYQTITRDLLFERVEYDAVIDNLQKIVDLNFGI